MSAMFRTTMRAGATLCAAMALAACGGPSGPGGEANEAAHQEGRTGDNPAPYQAQTATPEERRAIDQGATPEQNPPPKD